MTNFVKTFDTILETKRLFLRPFTLEDVEPSYQREMQWTSDTDSVPIYGEKV